MAKRRELSEYPATDRFKPVDVLYTPHPYCITPKHVAYAADHYGGMLGEDAIQALESKHGRGICGVRGCTLRREDHKPVLLLGVDDPAEDLKDVPGLQEYLLQIKPLLEEDGYDGVAFQKGF